MADETYHLVYTCDTSNILAGNNNVIRSLRLMDQVADRVKPKLAALFKGVGAAAGGVAPKMQQAATSMANVQASANAAIPAVTNLGASLRQLNGSTVRASVSSQQLTTGLGGVAGAHAGLMMVREAMSVVKDALDDARKYAHETADELLKVNDVVRELRMTKGEGTTTDQARQEVVDLMLKSGADFKHAAAFDTMWESTVPAAKKKGNWGLNAKETQEAKAQALAYAVASGMDEKTIGEVVPLIAASGKVASKEDLLGKIGVMGKLAVEGVGNLSPMMKVYEKLRGDMVRPGGGGAFKSDQELMGAISSTSVNAGNVPAVTTAVRQVWRDLSFADNADKEETFKKYDIRPGDDYQTRIRKIAPLVKDAQARGMTELDALYRAGFRRTQSNPKIIQAVGEQEVLGKNLEAAREAPDGAAVMRENARFRAENPDRFAEAAGGAAKLKRGEKFKDYEVLRKFAEAQGTNAGALNTPLANVVEGIIDMKIPYVGSVMQGIGQEPAHDKALDAIISGHILANVPNAAKRFPDLNKGISLNPIDQPARSFRLAEIIRNLTPEERAKLTAEMEKAAQPGAVPAQRVGPQASIGGPTGLQGALASTLLGAVPGEGRAAGADGVQVEMLAELRKLNAAVRGGGTAQPRTSTGPLRPDVDESGNARK